MFSEELARRFAGTGVTANSCDPGFKHHRSRAGPARAGVLAKLLTRMGAGDPRRGAGVIVRLAIVPVFVTVGVGCFLVKDAGPLTCWPPGRGAKVQRVWWEETSRLVEKVLSTAL
ncbi:hypothetical protein [Streptomyces sp. NPDC093261]|uniref:hypothetical protein n=1 Tax=Streptomyces sp. NPDC093261 TaxID=3366037 RepID=UPI00382D6E04